MCFKRNWIRCSWRLASLRDVFPRIEMDDRLSLRTSFEGDNPRGGRGVAEDRVTMRNVSPRV